MDFGQHRWTLGAIIRQAREDAGISRTGLAKITGISPNSMVKYEKAGEPEGKFPSLQNMAKIAQKLDIDPRRIFDMCLDDQADYSFSLHFYTFDMDERDDALADPRVIKAINLIREVGHEHHAFGQMVEHYQGRARASDNAKPGEPTSEEPIQPSTRAGSEGSQ